MRRLLAPLLLVAVLASFPASLILIFIRGIIVSTADASGGGSDAFASSCSMTQYYYDGGACGRGMAPPAAYDANGMSGTSSFVGSRLFAHAITTHHHDVLLPPSRYPMVIATAASVAAAATTASTTTTMTSSSSSPSSSGGNIGIVRSVMADSSHSRGGGGSSGNNYYKPRQARSASGPGQQEPGSPLQRQQQREIAVEVRGGYEKVPKSSSSSSSSSSSASQHQRHSPRGAAEPPPDTLKVTVLGPLRGKSSSCTYSLVEFTNTVSVHILPRCESNGMAYFILYRTSRVKCLRGEPVPLSMNYFGDFPTHYCRSF